MKNKKLKNGNKKRSRQYFALLLLAVLGVTTVLFYRYHDNPNPASVTQDNSADSSAQDSVDKKKFIESDNKDGDVSGGQGQSPSGQPSKRIELSAKDSGNGSVTVFTKLYGYSSGTCTLKSTNSGRLDIQEAEVIYEKVFSSCAGFSVDKTTLGFGEWSISLTLKDGANVVGTQEINLEVK